MEYFPWNIFRADSPSPVETLRRLPGRHGDGRSGSAEESYFLSSARLTTSRHFPGPWERQPRKDHHAIPTKQDKGQRGSSTLSNNKNWTLT